ncbi:hypothetical protein Fot_25725 [Forsythia ovata]|uniref:Uncharacterized protein n=1 Tax=Forsythia ovata TaxID=205694 RepID=A0ABD1U9V5_9LAMI
MVIVKMIMKILTDEIFCNGQIRPVFSIFERDLLLRNMNLKRENLGENGTKNSGSSKGPSRTVRLPLRKLIIEERETTSSDSSSEADELDGVPPETYCVWRQKASAEEAVNAEAEGPCKKSNSTGSSKRWRFKDLMNWSHSDSRPVTTLLPS